MCLGVTFTLFKTLSRIPCMEDTKKAGMDTWSVPALGA